jgi:hypothetical protein
MNNHREKAPWDPGLVPEIVGTLVFFLIVLAGSIGLFYLLSALLRVSPITF